MSETWKDISGFEGLYQVSNKGHIKSLKRKSWNGFKYFFLRERILKTSKSKSGYLRCVLRNNDKNYFVEVHRIVAEHFCDKIASETDVNHIDCDKENNCAENLEWVTKRQNMRHAVINGLVKSPALKGSAHGMAKLTEKDIKESRQLWSDGYSSRQIVEKLGLTVSSGACEAP